MSQCSDQDVSFNHPVSSAPHAGMNTAPQAQEWVSTDDVAGVLTIFEPDCQILQWRRGGHVSAAQGLESAIADGDLRTGFRVVVEADVAQASLPLPAVSLAGVREDIAFLVEVYADLLGCSRVGLRLEYLHAAMCPRFHVDRTGIRMVCTYRGPGTEFLLSNAADRSKLGAAGGLSDETSGLIRDAQAIGRAQAFDVVLLKGSLWQANTGGGAIHRSPMLKPEQAPRVVVALDAVW